MAQDGPKMPKMAPRRPKIAPKWPKIDPRWPKMPKSANSFAISLRCYYEGTVVLSRGDSRWATTPPHSAGSRRIALEPPRQVGADAAKTGQEHSKMRPHGTKRGSRGLQCLFGSIFGRFSVPTCPFKSTKIDEKSMPRCLPLLTPFFDGFWVRFCSQLRPS